MWLLIPRPHPSTGVISKSVSKERQQSYIAALTEALEVGSALLKNGGTALDATEAGTRLRCPTSTPNLSLRSIVVRYLEDCPLFNAGKGAVYTNKVRRSAHYFSPYGINRLILLLLLLIQGNHELDASIMDGQTLKCGAVCGVTTIKNPITLARLVQRRPPPNNIY